jgi:hypothetical protein
MPPIPQIRGPYMAPSYYGINRIDGMSPDHTFNICCFIRISSHFNISLIRIQSRRFLPYSDGAADCPRLWGLRSINSLLMCPWWA